MLCFSSYLNKESFRKFHRCLILGVILGTKYTSLDYDKWSAIWTCMLMDHFCICFLIFIFTLQSFSGIVQLDFVSWYLNKFGESLMLFVLAVGDNIVHLQTCKIMWKFLNFGVNGFQLIDSRSIFILWFLYYLDLSFVNLELPNVVGNEADLGNWIRQYKNEGFLLLVKWLLTSIFIFTFLDRFI